MCTLFSSILITKHLSSLKLKPCNTIVYVHALLQLSYVLFQATIVRRVILYPTSVTWGITAPILICQAMGHSHVQDYIIEIYQVLHRWVPNDMSYYVFSDCCWLLLIAVPDIPLSCQSLSQLASLSLSQLTGLSLTVFYWQPCECNIQ